MIPKAPDDEQNALALSAQLVKVRPPVHRSKHSAPPPGGETLTAEPVVLPTADDSVSDVVSGPDETATDDTAPPASASSLRTPNIVGVAPPSEPLELYVRNPNRYEILGEHGRGGLGRVMRARDKDLDRSVAIKELLRPSRTAEARFVREATITAKLQHPGIVPVHEAGRWPDGTPFYAMKLVEGTPLRELIHAAKTLEARMRLIPHVLAVADAVAYAHSQGVIHRDLKPSNVIVGSFGETVVIDWGLAKSIADVRKEPAAAGPFRGASAGVEVTAAGAVVGTPAYMPPEQADGSSVDERADVYALGAILRNVVTGALHSPGDDMRAVRGRRSADAAVSPELRAILRRATASTASARYQSVDEFRSDLARFQSGGLVGAHRYTMRELLCRWVRQHRAATLASGIAVLTVLIVMAISFRRVRNEHMVAVDARARAEDAYERAERERNTLVLRQAREAVGHDPTAAIAWLKRYEGDDLVSAQALAAAALARGVASRVCTIAEGQIWQVETSAGGDFILSGGADRAIRKVLPDSGEASVLASDVNGPFALARDDGIVAFVSRDVAYLQDIGSGARVTLGEISGVVTAAAIESTGRYAVFGDADGKVSLYVPAGESRVLHLHDGAVRWLAVTMNGHVVSTGADGIVRVRRARESFSSVLGSSTSWSRLGVASEVDLVVWSDAAGHASVSSLDGQYPRTFDLGAAEVGPFAVSRDGRFVALATPDWRVEVIDLLSGRIIYSARTNERSFGLSFAPSSPVFAYTDSNRIVVVDLLNEETASITGTGGASSIVFTRDGSKIVAGGSDGALRVWPVPRLWAKSLTTEGSLILSLAASPDGQLLAASSSSGQVWIWDTDGWQREKLVGPQDGVPQVVFSPNGKMLAGGSFDGRVHVWEVEGGGRRVLSGLRGAVWDLRFLDDDTLIAASEDHRLRVWHLASASYDELIGHKSAPRSFAQVADSLVLSGAEDGELWLWDITDGTGRLVATADSMVNSVTPLPVEGGAAIATASGELLEWRLGRSSTRWIASFRTRRLVADSDGRWMIAAADRQGVVFDNRLGARAFRTKARIIGVHIERAGTDSPVFWMLGVDGTLHVTRETEQSAAYLCEAGAQALSIADQFFAVACGDGEIRIGRSRPEVMVPNTAPGLKALLTQASDAKVGEMDAWDYSRLGAYWKERDGHEEDSE